MLNYVHICSKKIRKMESKKFFRVKYFNVEIAQFSVLEIVLLDMHSVINVDFSQCLAIIPFNGKMVILFLENVVLSV